MVSLTAATVAVALASFPTVGEDGLAARRKPSLRERSWEQILSGFSLGLLAGPSVPLPLDLDRTGARFGLRADFRLAASGPVGMDLVLPLFVRHRQEGDTTLGGVEVMPAVAAWVRPFSFLRVALEGGFGMLLLTDWHADGSTSDHFGLAVRASLPVEVRLFSHLWLGVTPSVLRDLTARVGYGELMLGVTVRY